MVISSTAPAHSRIFDRTAVRKHRRRAFAGDWKKYGFLVGEVADRLADRLEDITEPFSTALDLGCHGGEMGDILLARQRVNHLVQADLAPGLAAATGRPTFAADEELLPLKDGALDLVVSNLSLHWVNDLPGSLIQIARSLRPNGLFLASMFGAGSLEELRRSMMQAEMEISNGSHPRVSPFTEIRDAGGLLQRAGMALAVTDADLITLKYDTPFALMRELRGLGLGNALAGRQKSFTRRDVLMRAAEIYAESYGDEDGKIPASFQIIYLTGWAPHESQQQPLKRGSADTSLTDILGNS